MPGREKVNVHHSLVVAGPLSEVWVFLLLCLNIVVIKGIVGPHINDDRLAPRSHTNRGLGDGVSSAPCDCPGIPPYPVAFLAIRLDPTKIGKFLKNLVNRNFLVRIFCMENSVSRVDIYNEDYVGLNHAYVQMYKFYNRLLEASDADDEVLSVIREILLVFNPTLDRIKSEMTVKTRYKEDISETDAKVVNGLNRKNLRS